MISRGRRARRRAVQLLRRRFARGVHSGHRRQTAGRQMYIYLGIRQHIRKVKIQCDVLKIGFHSAEGSVV